MAVEPYNSEKDKRGKDKEELRNLMKTVTDFSSQALVGLERKHHKDDILSRLGVPPPKEQTMPLKMKLGILAGREKRKKRKIDEAKESGEVLSRQTLNNISKKSHIHLHALAEKRRQLKQNKKKQKY